MIKDKESLNKKLQDQNDELIASQNQYRIILEKSSDGVFRFDAEGKILTSNSMFHSPLGFEAEGIVGRPIMKIINPEDSSGIYPKIATHRCGDRATSNLKIQFCINENVSIWQERKHSTLLLDAYGIWNLPNNKLYEIRNREKVSGDNLYGENPIVKTSFGKFPFFFTPSR